jgi:Tripartite tricarboxylate transporter TctB family
MGVENILLMVLAVVGIYEGVRLIGVPLLIDDPVGPGWYLLFMSILLFICACTLLMRRARSKTVSQTGGLSFLKGPAGQSFLLLLFYGLAALSAGYLIASALFFLLGQRVFGERSWARAAVLGLAMTGSFYLVFSRLAGVPLP